MGVLPGCISRAVFPLVPSTLPGFDTPMQGPRTKMWVCLFFGPVIPLTTNNDFSFHPRRSCIMALGIIICRVLRRRQITYWQNRTTYSSFSKLSRAGFRHLEKGWIVRVTLTGSSNKLEQVVPIYSLSISTWLTAKHWPDASRNRMIQ